MQMIVGQCHLQQILSKICRSICDFSQKSGKSNSVFEVTHENLTTFCDNVRIFLKRFKKRPREKLSEDLIERSVIDFYFVLMTLRFRQSKFVSQEKK